MQIENNNATGTNEAKKTTCRPSRRHPGLRFRRGPHAAQLREWGDRIKKKAANR